MRSIISPKESIIRLAEIYPFELTDGNLSCVFNNRVTPIQYNPDDEYKPSVFNYVCVGSRRVAIYNTLYSSLSVLSFEEYEKICDISKCEDELAREMVHNGFWVKKYTDERQFYLDCSSYLNDLCSRNIVTLAVTHNCNARCNYCYENGIKHSSMNEKVINGIVDFAAKLGDSIRINWFGGEPLLNTKAIDRISIKLHEHNIEFSSYLITNGSLLNDEIIKRMTGLWNVKDVQISIDGLEETYLRIKNYKNPDENLYYKLLGNIIKLAKSDIFVHIRINISHNNISEISELQKELENVFSKYDNIIIYPAFVTGTGEPFNEEEMIDIVTKMMKNTRNISKLTADAKLFSLPRLHSCAVQSKNSFTIDSDGYIYKCEHHVGDKNASLGSVDSIELINNETGVNVMPICYSAGYKEEGMPQGKPYNLTKLLMFIVKYTPAEKRMAYFDNINRDKNMWESDDGLEDYKEEVRSSFRDSFMECVTGGSEIGGEIGSIFGRGGEVVGKVVGGVIGGVVGVIGGIFSGIGSLFGL